MLMVEQNRKLLITRVLRILKNLDCYNWEIKYDNKKLSNQAPNTEKSTCIRKCFFQWSAPCGAWKMKQPTAMKRGFATRRRLVCASLHANESEHFIRAYRVLNICVGRCFIKKCQIKLYSNIRRCRILLTSRLQLSSR